MKSEPPFHPHRKGLSYMKRQRFSPPPGSSTPVGDKPRTAWFGWGVKGVLRGFEKVGLHCLLSVDNNAGKGFGEGKARITISSSKRC